jgi:lysophospholipase L1-like esterase
MRLRAHDNPRHRGTCAGKCHQRIFASAPLLLFYGVLTVCICACSAERPQLSPLSDDAVILAFGDSLTKGTGAPDGADYPAVLSRLSGRRVVNAGVPGELSAAGVKRLPQILDATRPQLLILCHGGNDILRRRSTSQLMQNLRTMIELAQARGVQVVLIGVPKPGLLLGPADVYQHVAAAMGVPVELDVLTQVLGDAEMKSDPIHPNATGYERIAEALFTFLTAAGAIR